MRERSGLERELRDLGLHEVEREFELESLPEGLSRLWRRGKEHVCLALAGLKALVQGQGVLGKTKGGRDVKTFYFPGRTVELALIIGGVHGSELSGIEVVERLVDRLRTNSRPHFSVIIVPRLFPDNAAKAEEHRRIKPGSTDNVGRNTDDKNPTNRQYPWFGRAFDPSNPVDSLGRPMEPETFALLTLVECFRPSRIASVHAEHTEAEAGIFADPRTAAPAAKTPPKRLPKKYRGGKALDFAEDKRLALAMARHAQRHRANVPGNKLTSTSGTARYPGDPNPVGAGEIQPRNTEDGVSGGGWFATAVNDPTYPERNRPPITTITVEVQFTKRIEDVPVRKRDARKLEIDAHVSALRNVFLEPLPPARP